MTAESFSQVVSALAAVAAAIIGAVGLSTWRNQLRGQTSYELARRVLRALLEIRDQIEAVRFPMIHGAEFSAAYAEAGLEPPADGTVADAKASQLVYDRRWRSLSSAQSKFQAELLEAEVLWGRSIRGPEVELRRCIAELYSAVSMHIRAQLSNDPRGSLARIVEQQFRTLYKVDSPDDPDVFGRRVNEAVEQFENLLRPRLRIEKDSV